MKEVFLFCQLLLFSSLLKSQSHTISGGFGNFEGFNVSMHHHTKKVIYQYGYGTDLNLYGQGFYHSVFAGIGRPLLKEWVHTSNMMSLHGKILIWNLENKSNIFSAVAFSPQLQYTRKISTFYSASVYLGYVYSSVFRYKRKSYEEIGWPREWLPNFGFSIHYCLSCK